jgi:hypothetical protein
MMMRLMAFTMAFAIVLSQAAQTGQDTSHIDFSLVRGSTGFVSSGPGGTMTDAPYTVLGFTAADGHKTLVMTDAAGDYTAVLPPGHYCLSAYQVKTGDPTPLDPRQLKCFDVLAGKDARLDVMLGKRQDEKALPNQAVQEPTPKPSPKP